MPMLRVDLWTRGHSLQDPELHPTLQYPTMELVQIKDIFGSLLVKGPKEGIGTFLTCDKPTTYALTGTGSFCSVHIQLALQPAINLLQLISSFSFSSSHNHTSLISQSPLQSFAILLKWRPPRRRIAKRKVQIIGASPINPVMILSQERHGHPLHTLPYP